MRRKAVIVFNIFIVIFTLVGVYIMLDHNSNDGSLLSSSGWENLKYFTVLSNIFCGIVAVIFLVQAMLVGRGKMIAEKKKEADGPTVVLHRKDQKVGYPLGIMILKLTAAAAVAVTFLVVACFFGNKRYKPIHPVFNLLLKTGWKTVWNFRIQLFQLRFSTTRWKTRPS